MAICFGLLGRRQTNRALLRDVAFAQFRTDSTGRLASEAGCVRRKIWIDQTVMGRLTTETAKMLETTWLETVSQIAASSEDAVKIGG